MTMKLLKFEAEWCGPCKVFSKTWNSFTSKNPAIEYEVVDVDKNPEIASKYGVKGIPMVLAVKGDRVVGSLSGVQTEPALKLLVTVSRNK
jgi:thioredoxin-like negative regulator of GroEL